MAGRGERPSRAARRVGYVVAAGVNIALWYLVNVRPGWQVVPFLTDDVTRVLGLFNLSLLAEAVANLAYVVFDARWFRAGVEVGLSLIGVLLAWQIFDVFPVDFTGLSYDLTTLARVLVIVGLVGSGIGLLAAVVRFGREIYRAAGGAATPR